MTEIVLTAGVAAFIVFVVFQIAYLLELRNTSRAVRRLIERVEKTLEPALGEVEPIMKNLRHTSENVVDMSRNLRQATDIAGILAGLWAALKAGLSALAQKSSEKKEEQRDA